MLGFLVVVYLLYVFLSGRLIGLFGMGMRMVVVVVERELGMGGG